MQHSMSAAGFMVTAAPSCLGFKRITAVAVVAFLLSCGRPPSDRPPSSNHESQAEDPSFGTVGKDGLFHASPALLAQIAKEDAEPSISDSDAMAHCSLALEKRLGRKPRLTLQDHFQDGGRFFVEGEAGSAASRTNCFVEKTGVVSNLRVAGSS